MENDSKQTSNEDKRRSIREPFPNKKIYQIKDEGNITYSNYGKIELFSPKKIKTIVANKIIFLNNLHDYFYHFSTNIHNIFSKVNLYTQKKLENTLDQNKYFLKFFKDTMGGYERFSSELIKSKAVLNVSLKEENMLFHELTSMIDKSQESFATNMLNFASTLNQDILLKGPLTQMKVFYSRMKNLNKQVNEDLFKIKSKNEKIIRKYSSYQEIWQELYKLQEEEQLSNYFSQNEFFIFEVSYIKTMNNILELYKSFLVNYIKVFDEYKIIIYDFLTSMKETIEIYLEACKKVFLDYSQIEKIQKAFENINKESLDFSFQPGIFFKENLKEINDCLKEFQIKLTKNNFVKYESIYQDECFQLENYKNLEDFLIFFLDFIPESHCLDNSSLITFINDVNYDPGVVFSSWKPAVLVLTIQNNVFIFEKRLQKKYSEKICLLNIKYTEKLNTKGSEDFHFELCEEKKGFFTKSRKVVLEAMNKDIFTDIRNVFSYYLKYSGTKVIQNELSNTN